MTEQNENQSGKKRSKLEESVVFFFVWMGIATLTLGFFAVIDFLPEKPTTVEETEEVLSEEIETIEVKEVQVVEEYVGAPLPKTIIFDSLDKVVPILNPNSSAIDVLDTALLSGVVRHPESADFQKTGTIFLLGHSSYLPTVHNKNFQAFNGVQNLVWGDIIRLQSDDTEYVYSVDRVYEVKASDAMVPIQYDVAKLTLATCNSFGSKDDRYIVEATLISKNQL